MVGRSRGAVGRGTEVAGRLLGLGRGVGTEFLRGLLTGSFRGLQLRLEVFEVSRVGVEVVLGGVDGLGVLLQRGSQLLLGGGGVIESMMSADQWFRRGAAGRFRRGLAGEGRAGLAALLAGCAGF